MATWSSTKIRWGRPRAGSTPVTGTNYLLKGESNVDEKLDKRMFKKSSEELQEYLQFQRRGSKVEPKKGKGSYKRKPKHKEENQDCI